MPSLIRHQALWNSFSRSGFRCTREAAARRRWNWRHWCSNITARDKWSAPREIVFAGSRVETTANNMSFCKSKQQNFICCKKGFVRHSRSFENNALNNVHYRYSKKKQEQTLFKDLRRWKYKEEKRDQANNRGNYQYNKRINGGEEKFVRNPGSHPEEKSD